MSQSNRPSGAQTTGAGSHAGRRAFLKAAGLAGLGGAAAAALPAATQAYEPPAEQVASRYRRNAHVERFYFLNRL